MAKLSTKQAVRLQGGIRVRPGKTTYVPDEQVMDLLAAGGGMGQRMVAAGLLFVERDGHDRSDRARRIEDVVDARMRWDEKAQALEQDELEEAQKLYQQKRTAKPLSRRVQRTGAPLPLEETSRVARGAPEMNAGDDVNPATQVGRRKAELEAANRESHTGDKLGSGRTDVRDEAKSEIPYPNLHGFTIPNAEPIIAEQGDAELLSLWRELDKREGIHRLIDERLETLTAPDKK